MKRPNPEVSGLPKRLGSWADVAGRRLRPATEVATHRLEPSVRRDAALIENFADFLDGEDETENATLAFWDVSFMERLRRRLWRNFVLAPWRSRHTTH